MTLQLLYRIFDLLNDLSQEEDEKSMALSGAKLTLSSKVGFVLQIVLAGNPAAPGFQIEITTQTYKLPEYTR